MAEVFLAEDGQLGRKVALKLLYRRFAEDPDFVERFRREAQAAAGLQHPNVVSVYDRGTFDGTYYIAMEYLPGPSLKELIRSEAPLDPLRAIDITLQILKAARFAHRRGVIHRDLKPHNVLIDDGDHAKVTDFGIARAGASDMTETGSIMGTAQYLSPEQAQGHAVNPTSDLYSIGVILYEMLTGRVPFEAESAVTIAIKHVSEAPVPPSQINPAVPPELEQVVLWTLNKNPADRPADADALIAALEAAREVIARLSPAGSGRRASWSSPSACSMTRPSEEDEEERQVVAVGARRAASCCCSPEAPRRYLLTRTSDKVVPTVVGEKVDVAQTQIQNAGFTPNLSHARRPGAVGHGHRPEPARRHEGRLGLDGDAHRLERARQRQHPVGRRPHPAPGRTRQLSNAHLKVANVVSQASARVAPGQAIKTDPPAGDSVPYGSGVSPVHVLGQAARRCARRHRPVPVERRVDAPRRRVLGLDDDRRVLDRAGRQRHQPEPRRAAPRRPIGFDTWRS